jgi:hypothetical protein
MKNVLKVFGIIALAAVIVFPIVSCEDSIFGGMLTISGLKDYNGKYVVAFGSDKSETIHLLASANANNQTLKGIKIEGGSVLLSVWIAEGTQDKPTYSAYRGSDTLKFAVSIYDTAIVNDNSEAIKEGWAIVTFKNGVGAGVFFDFDIDFPDDGGNQNSGTSVEITVPSSLEGTWKGDDSNGTLVFTASSISTPPDLIYTKAYACITAIKKANTGSNSVTINGNGTNGTITYTTGGIVGLNATLYTWTISDATLTIKDVNGTLAFTGTKQP